MEIALIHIVPIIVTSFVTWLFARKKNLAETRSLEIDTEIKAAEFYKDLLDDAIKRLNTAIRTINKQEKRIKELLEREEALKTELKKTQTKQTDEKN